ncbi:ribonuclease H-like domain-containing protein [Tanacetum coccineum]
MEHCVYLLKPPYQPENSFRSLEVEWLTLHEVLVCAFSCNRPIASTILISTISISSISISTISISTISIVAVTAVLALNLSLECVSNTCFLMSSQCFFHTSVNEFLDCFRGHTGANTAYLLLHVDDIILTASSTSLLQRIISSLHAEFVMTDLDPLNYFLGISATRTTSGIFLSQTKYATEILERAHMLNFQQLCLYMHDPREPHLNAMKRVLRYIRGTTDLGLQLFRSTTSQLIAYSDANWAGCPATHRSTCVFLGDNLLTWSSKRQDTLSRSSAEAVYRGVTNAVAETSWIRNLLRELHTSLFTATLVYYDNVSAVYMSANPVQHQRTKHIEIDIHFVRDKVAACHIRVLHVPS